MTDIITKDPDKKFGDVEYYGTLSVADILEIDPTTVRNYFQKGYFRGVKIGQNWYINKGDLEFFIINGKLKIRKDMSFQDYKIAESNFLTRIEDNVRKAKKQIEKYREVRSPHITANLIRRYEELQLALEEYRKNKMTQKDYDTFI
ncbi:hypothetical protein ES705_11124 [subsurface metagenome]